jgi:hypothetical protein
MIVIDMLMVHLMLMMDNMILYLCLHICDIDVRYVHLKMNTYRIHETDGQK